MAVSVRVGLLVPLAITVAFGSTCAVATSAHAQTANVSDWALAGTERGFELVLAKSGQVFRQPLSLLAEPVGSPALIASQRTPSFVAARAGFAMAPGANASLLAFRDSASGRTSARYFLLPHAGLVSPIEAKPLDLDARHAVAPRASGGFFATRIDRGMLILDAISERGIAASTPVSSASDVLLDEVGGELVVASYTGSVLRTQRLTADGAPGASAKDAWVKSGLSGPFFLINHGQAHVFLANGAGSAQVSGVALPVFEQGGAQVLSARSEGALVTAASDSDSVFVVVRAGATLRAFRFGRDGLQNPPQGVLLPQTSGLAADAQVATACTPASCAVVWASAAGSGVQTLAVGRDGAISGPYEVAIKTDAAPDAAAAEGPFVPQGLDTRLLDDSSSCRCSESGANGFPGAAILTAFAVFARRRPRSRTRSHSIALHRKRSELRSQDFQMTPKSS
jgi:hypothetical protein